MHGSRIDSRRTNATRRSPKRIRRNASGPMSWLVRAFRTRERRHATVPLTLAIVVVALGILLYLELVTILLAYAG